jgi:hypothetical protein
MTPEERIAAWDANSDRPMNADERNVHLTAGEDDEQILYLAMVDVRRRQERLRRRG